MKNIGDYIDEYRILWPHYSSMLYECYIVERATNPGALYVLQKWKTVCFAGSQGYTRFLSQMSRLKALRQPLILPVEDFGVDTDEHPYVLLPYETAQMERLSERLQHGTLSEDEAENILTDVSTALVLAHQHDLIHGFFSPESVLLTPSNEVRVTAFLCSDPDLSDVRYSLPIQYRFPESSASRLSDQYALASLVQNLLLEQGKLPEDAANIRRIIARARAPVPAQRFESIREFLGKVGYLLDVPENEKELETPPSYSASQRANPIGSAQPGGAPPAQRQHVTWSRLAAYTRALGRMGRLARALQSRFWINLIAASLLTLATVLTFVHYLGSWEYAASDAQPLEIVGSCGENITIDLHMADTSVNGLWASNSGLRMTLQGVTQPVVVVPPSPETWGDEIYTRNMVGGETLVVSGTFALPCPRGEIGGQVLSGHITGDVLYPAPVGGDFEDQDPTIDIPVRVHVVTWIAQLWGSGALAFWILAGLESVLLLAMFGTLFWVITRRRGTALLRRIFGETRADRITSLKGLMGGVLLAALVGGLLLLLIKTGPPSSADVQNCMLVVVISIIGALLGFVIRGVQRVRRSRRF